MGKDGRYLDVSTLPQGRRDKCPEKPLCQRTGVAPEPGGFLLEDWSLQDADSRYDAVLNIIEPSPPSP
jgi:hypothetical protein